MTGTLYLLLLILKRTIKMKALVLFYRLRNQGTNNLHNLLNIVQLARRRNQIWTAIWMTPNIIFFLLFLEAFLWPSTVRSRSQRWICPRRTHSLVGKVKHRNFYCNIFFFVNLLVFLHCASEGQLEKTHHVPSPPPSPKRQPKQTSRCRVWKILNEIYFFSTFDF